MSTRATAVATKAVPASVRKCYVIDPGSAAHRVLLAMRAGSPVEHEQLIARIGYCVSTMLIHLQAAGYVERTAGKSTNKGAVYRITDAGRIACPPRRGTFQDFPDFSTKPLGDLS